MSSDSTTMLIGIARSAAAVSQGQLLRTQNCPDCCGRSVINLVGEEVPCPSCRTEEYREAMLALGIDPGITAAELEAVGAGSLK